MSSRCFRPATTIMAFPCFLVICKLRLIAVSAFIGDELDDGDSAARIQILGAMLDVVEHVVDQREVDVVGQRRVVVFAEHGDCQNSPQSGPSDPRPAAAIRSISNDLRNQNRLPTQTDGAARPEFERAAPQETFRAPPDRSPAEPPGTKVGFSSTTNGN
jgi:hypothetical protein